MKAKFPIPEHIINYWLANWQSQTCTDMGAKFGYHNQVVIRHLKKRGIVIPKELSFKLRGQKLKGRTSSTPVIDQQIRENYLNYPVKKLARILNVGQTFLRARIKQLGLVIPPELIEQRKRESYIQKGNIPFNKGMKLEEFMSPETVQKFRKNTFKKGNIPHNAYNQIGKITIRSKKDGTERYKFICIELGKWELLQQHVWRQVHGEIPKGHLIRFVDGDSMNCDISNLKCVSMAENLAQNNLTDTAIASRLAFTGRGQIDKGLRDLIIKDHPELIKIRRLEHQLNKELRNQKHHE